MYCIAGKNQCSINALEYLLKREDIDNENIIVCVNEDDDGNDNWQPSLKKLSNYNYIKIFPLEDLYKIDNLYFFSLEFDKIIKTANFQTDKLFNFHFSLLPKYRGCHTNYLQIRNGEVNTGVSCHLIDDGIDSGDIIEKSMFEININDTAKDNYIKLMECASELFIKLFDKLINGDYNLEKQDEQSATYYSRSHVNYEQETINFNQEKIKIHNEIRSLIFPPYQYPLINGVKIKKSKLVNDKIILIDESMNEKEY